jgi:hypothetical protein
MSRMRKVLVADILTKAEFVSVGYQFIGIEVAILAVSDLSQKKSP